uniref:RRM domain-containing protein n=1 Tax=Oryza barthii TaxID=65489 RepID=A0A0D3EUF6_9ORYZ
MPKQQNAASGTSKLSVQARPFYPATSSNFTAAPTTSHVVVPTSVLLSPRGKDIGPKPPTQREATDSEGEEAGEPQEGVRGRGAARDKRTGAVRGFAFVQFVNPDAAIAAESDRNMDVKLAQPNPPAGGPQLSLGDQKRKTFLGSLPTSLKEYFSKFNEVDRAILVTDLNMKMPRWFASEESAARALKKDRHFLYGQWVEVSLAMPKQQNATSGTSKLLVQAHPFYPVTSSNFTAAANYPSVVNIVHVVTPMNCVVGNTFNPHIGFEVPGMKLSDGVTNVVTANYSYQYPYLGGGEVPPQNSAMYLQAAHYYSGAMM